MSTQWACDKISANARTSFLICAVAREARQIYIVGSQGPRNEHLLILKNATTACLAWCTLSSAGVPERTFSKARFIASGILDRHRQAVAAFDYFLEGARRIEILDRHHVGFGSRQLLARRPTKGRCHCASWEGEQHLIQRRSIRRSGQPAHSGHSILECAVLTET